MMLNKVAEIRAYIEARIAHYEQMMFVDQCDAAAEAELTLLLDKLPTAGIETGTAIDREAGVVPKG